MACRAVQAVTSVLLIYEYLIYHTILQKSPRPIIICCTPLILRHLSPALDSAPSVQKKNHKIKEYTLKNLNAKILYKRNL